MGGETKLKWASLFLSLFFVVAGLIFLFHPEELRDSVLGSYRRVGFARAVFLQRLMFTRGYIVAFRIAGGLAIIIGGLLPWLYFHSANH
jgi:hypothetical protein